MSKSKIKVMPKRKKEEKTEVPIKKKRFGFYLMLIVVIAVVILAYKKFPAFNTGMGVTDNNIAALVNGIEISNAELDEKYSRLPPLYQASITKEDLLSQLIDEKLLIMEAESLNIDVSDDEIEASLDQLLEDSMLTRDDLDARLESQGMTYEEFKTLFKNDIIVRELINLTVFMDIEVTDDDLQNYYNENTELFTQPAGINVSHIIICHDESTLCLGNRTKEEAKDLITSLKKQITDSNFGIIAQQLSDEPSAKNTKGNLGIVTTADPYDPVFLEAAFALEEDELSDVVETQFGFHLIKVWKKYPELVLEYELVKPDIEQQVLYLKQQEGVQQYLLELREKAEVQILIA